MQFLMTWKLSWHVSFAGATALDEYEEVRGPEAAGAKLHAALSHAHRFRCVPCQAHVYHAFCTLCASLFKQVILPDDRFFF